MGGAATDTCMYVPCRLTGTGNAMSCSAPSQKITRQKANFAYHTQQVQEVHSVSMCVCACVCGMCIALFLLFAHSSSHTHLEASHCTS